MRDDVSAIDSTWCNVLTSSDTLVSYSPDRHSRSDYSFSGGRWIKYRTSTSTYGYDISGYNCITLSDLNSFAIYEPVLHFISFCLVGLVLYLFFRLIRGFLYGFSK